MDNMDNTVKLIILMGMNVVVIEALMLIFWVCYTAYRKYNFIDISWALGFVAAALVDFVFGEGFIGRRTLILLIVSIWSLRMVLLFSRRLMSDQEENSIYRYILQKWPYPNHRLGQSLSLFLFQGILITILALPFALMSENTWPFFSTYEVFGLLIWMGGLVGAAVADRQLEVFKLNPANQGKIYRWGLWSYSRHPNYFFEWIVWLGYCVMTFSSPLGWLGLLSPLIMFYLLIKLSGIPLTEAEEKDEAAYQQYQATTSSFFPWFNKTETSAPSSDNDINKTEK